MSTSSPTPQLSPTVFLPPRADGTAADPAFAWPGFLVAPLADAAPGTAPHAPDGFEDGDLITGVSLTFDCLPLGGAIAARGFVPFALP